MLPHNGFTCTNSVAEYLIILCSRTVFGCGEGSWFKPKVKIFLLYWEKTHQGNRCYQPQKQSEVSRASRFSYHENVEQPRRN